MNLYLKAGHIVAHTTPDGNVDYLSTVMREMRQQHTARLELERSEKKYRALFEESRDVILSGAVGGRLLDINPAGAT